MGLPAAARFFGETSNWGAATRARSGSMDSLLLLLLGSFECDLKRGCVDGDFRSATIFWSEGEEWEECDNKDEEEETKEEEE